MKLLIKTFLTLARCLNCKSVYEVKEIDKCPYCVGSKR
jgi:rRNA maturation endonuclease Nob1